MINLLKHKVPSMYLAIISLAKIPKDIELTVHGWVQQIIFELTAKRSWMKMI